MTLAPSDIGQRLDALPLGAFHNRLALIIGAGLLVDGVDVYLTAGVSGALVKEGVASFGQVAQLAMATTLGLGLGGLISGFLGDRLGRRRTMQWTIVLVIVGSIGAAFSPSFEALLGWRLLTSLGLGGETVLAYAMLGEFMPPAWRGRWLARLGFLANLGMPLGLALGYFVLPNAEGWRTMLAIPGIAAIAVFILRRQLTESPRWLQSRGRHAEAERIVAQIETGAAIVGASARDTSGPSVAKTSAPRVRLFTSENRGKLAAAIAINIAIMSAIFGFVSWLPTFFVQSGLDIANSTLFAGVMSLGAPIGTLIGMLITDRIERKWGIVVTSLLAIGLGIVYASADGAAEIMISGLAMVITLYVFGTLGLIGYVPELFATGVRMRAIGLCATIGRAFIFVLPLAVVVLFERFGQAGVIVLVSIILAIQAAVVAIFGVRTRGRALEAV
jgi:MFS transporter, putative metabolite:H+ symporter